MQSVIQKKLLKNVRIYYLNKEEVIKILKERVKICVAERKEIKKIILFGSFCKRNPTVYDEEKNFNIPLLKIAKKEGILLYGKN